MNKHSKVDVFAPAAMSVAQGLDKIFARAPQQSFSDLKAAFDTFANELFGQEAAFKLEVKRRVAERVLAAAIAKGVPPPQCRRYLSKIARLGFTDLTQECAIRIIYCRYLAERGSTALATRTLKTLSKKCAKAKGEPPREIAECRKLVDALLREWSGI